jgi:ferritin-like metal-binding protein YciE
VPPTLSNPRDLFLQLLAEQLWVERTLAFEVLPKLERAATAERLVGILREHLDETREHAARLEQVFRAAGAEPSSNLSPAAAKRFEHHDELAGKIPEERLADTYHALAAVTTEHHELAVYDGLLALARALELGDARELLERNRSEDAAALERLGDQLRRLVDETSAR